jgi:acyl-homoserine lactone acylase PvdQ
MNPSALRRRAGVSLTAVALVAMLSACDGSSSGGAGDDGGGTSGGTTGGGTTGGGTTGSAAAGPDLFLNVLPPGSNGNSAGGIGLPVGPLPVFRYPDNFVDQLSLYGNLASALPNLRSAPCAPPASIAAHQPASDLACNYFKSAGLEPAEADVVSSLALTSPGGGTATLRRDRWGVPFIVGDDRQAAMYALGYASAQDRLWLHDVLRAIGRGRFSEFLGPAADTFDFDGNIAVVGGYSEDELTEMVEVARARFGALGELAIADLDSMVAGINDYIARLSGPALLQRPPEYVTLRLPGLGDGVLPFPPRPWTRNDIVASAILIQSIFAVGGGSESTSELLLQRLDPSFTAGATTIPDAACRYWRDVRHANDPDATRTISARFATQAPPAVDESCPQALPAGAAIWDVGSVRPRAVLVSGGEPLANPIVPLPLPVSAPAATPTERLRLIPSLFGALPPPARAAGIVPYRSDLPAPKPRTVFAALSPGQAARQALAAAGIPLPERMSNFIAVTGSQTASGHPIAVMGPQASYFVPQLLWEVAIRSNGGTPQDFAGRGIVFADLPYINIGRGLDFAWSATSGGSDLIDTRVSRMCNLDGSPASRDDGDGDGFPDADGYLHDIGDGPVCRRFFRRTDTWTARPTVASIGLGGPLLPQPVSRYVLRTHYGPVFATATVDGQPVAISQQRSTFYDEIGTIAPFALASTRVIHDAESFQQVFNGVTGTFNWLYVDADDVGYVHSGLYPKRHPQAHPELPVWGDGRYEWASHETLPDDYFARFESGEPYSTSRAVPVVRGDGDALKGYFEWPAFLSLAEHPTAINPPEGRIASWNNSPAADWWAADFDGGFGPTHRVDLLDQRLRAFQASGRRFEFANLVEIMGDSAFADLRGQAVLPQLLALMQAGPMTAVQARVVTLMQGWLAADDSRGWIGGPTPYPLALGALRRDRDRDGVYDQRAAAVLMDAWYPYLIDTVLPQLVAHDGFVAQGRYDAPRAQGSAYISGWYEHLKRVLDMALGVPGTTPYRALSCAGAGGDAGACRAAVLAALDSALARLGGIDNQADWDGTTLGVYSARSSDPAAGQTIEDYDAVRHIGLSLLPVPAIPWTNRPTFQQVVEVRNRRP